MAILEELIWPEFLKQVNSLSEKTAFEALEAERQHARKNDTPVRVSRMLRLYGRYNKLRTQRERVFVLTQSAK